VGVRGAAVEKQIEIKNVEPGYDKAEEIETWK